jgi:hypothetical protein
VRRARLLFRHERWGERLARSGFEDIEHPSGRLREWGHETAIAQSTPDNDPQIAEVETAAPIWDHPRAIFWRRATHAVEELPPNFPGRRILVIWTETGNLYEAARRCRVTVRRAITAMTRLRRHMDRKHHHRKPRARRRRSRR